MTDTTAAAALTTSLAEINKAFMNARLPMPTSVDYWTQHVTRDELLTWADRFGIGIKIHESYASITLRPVNLQPIAFHILTNHVTDDDRHHYDTHNAECVAAGPLAAAGTTMGTGNVKNDDRESLNFSDEA
jgi:hypothetical protein